MIAWLKRLFAPQVDVTYTRTLNTGERAALDRAFAKLDEAFTEINKAFDQVRK